MSTPEWSRNKVSTSTLNKKLRKQKWPGVLCLHLYILNDLYERINSTFNGYLFLRVGSLSFVKCLFFNLFFSFCFPKHEISCLFRVLYLVFLLLSSMLWLSKSLNALLFWITMIIMHSLCVQIIFFSFWGFHELRGA